MVQSIVWRKAVATNLQAVTRLWLRNGLKPSTVAIYRRWIRAFQRYCGVQRLRESQQLSLAGVRRFVEWYARKRRIRRAPAHASARSALYAWSGALTALGMSVPLWKPTPVAPGVRVPIIREFLDYRRRQCGVSVGTLYNDQATSLEFWQFLRRRKRTCHTVRLPDIDAFTARLRRRMGVVAVANHLTSVRALLRFLHVSGRLRFDLASSVVRPLIKVDRYPPKALPWSQVRCILRAVDRGTRLGRRDYAILLLMSLYGLGGAEVLGLRLEGPENPLYLPAQDSDYDPFAAAAGGGSGFGRLRAAQPAHPRAPSPSLPASRYATRTLDQIKLDRLSAYQVWPAGGRYRRLLG